MNLAAESEYNPLYNFEIIRGNICRVKILKITAEFTVNGKV